MKLRRLLYLCLLIILITFTGSFAQDQNHRLSITVSVADDLDTQVLSEGRLFIFLNKNLQVEPKDQIWPFPGSMSHIFAMNRSDLSADFSETLQANSDWTTTEEWTFENVPEGIYNIQVLWDQNEGESRINTPGNLYSEKMAISVSKPLSVEIEIGQIIEDRNVSTHDLVKTVDMKSELLSDFWDQPMQLKATVLLPKNYKEGKSYPIRYNVAGYGGRYTRVNYLVNNEDFMSWWTSDEAPEIINVFLDGEGPFGDSYQMDSENSGPYGEALISELIPHIETKFRGTDDSATRFIDGCSTGGWVSLGLQLYYPDSFAGVFSYSPDAIEFENYQLINIYKDQNAFVNEFGYERPVMRSTVGEPIISLRDFINYENVLGYSDTYVTSGGQFSAHTALYSPKGEDGLPVPLFDPISGEINSEVAEHWKKYDFKKYTQENWETLGPKLQGKIYVWMGDMDQFYLNPATREFAAFLDQTENPASDAVIEFAPTEGHCARFSHKTILENIQKKIDQNN